ncbi:MAG: putative metal-binding motif-containing protein [Myxococcales bacterium]|nr:putative metal-binding motif-containing protein [Myxococcales bacterium]
MDQCRTCEGFLPRSVTACPHCGLAVPPRRDGRGLAVAAMASVTFVTLAACYGAPECIDRRDADKDGSFACADDPRLSDDCDDNDASRRPGFPDPEGDGLDQNCDGVDGLREVVSARRNASATPALSASSTAQPATSASAMGSAAPSAAAPPSAR